MERLVGGVVAALLSDDPSKKIAPDKAVSLLVARFQRGKIEAVNRFAEDYAITLRHAMDATKTTTLDGEWVFDQLIAGLAEVNKELDQKDW
jgi:hypothetical protein